MKTKKEINYSLELLRVVACIMVICIHVSNYYCRGYDTGDVTGISYVVAVIWNGLSRVSVPIFFMISGSLLLAEPIQIRKSLKRVRNTLGSLLLWSFIYYLWNLLYRNRSYNVQTVLESPVKKHLWFLYAIVGIYLILPLLQSMIQNMSDKVILCFVVMWFSLLAIEYVLSILGAYIVYKVPLLGGSCYVGYFMLGYVMKENIRRIPLGGKMACGLSVATLATVILITCICTWSEGVYVDKLFENRNALIAVGSSLLFMAILRYHQYSEKMKEILCYISKHTFTIYLCHVIFIDIVKLEFAPRNINAIIGVPLYTLLVFVFSLLFSMGWNVVKKQVATWLYIVKERRIKYENTRS